MDQPIRLTELKVEGYRTLRDVRWQPGPLNVVIGPNASGKSNLLHWLRLCAACGRGGLERSIFAEGGMGAVLFDGKGSEIEMRLTVQAVRRRRTIRYDYRLALERVQDSSDFFIYSEVAGVVAETKDGYDNKTVFHRKLNMLTLPESMPEPQQNAILAAYRSATTLRSNPLLSSPILSLTNDPDLAEMQSFLASWVVHDAFQTGRGAPVRQPTVARTADRLDDDGANLASVLHTYYTSNLDFRGRIDDAMRAAFGDMYVEIAFPPAAEQQIQLAVRWSTLHRPETAANLSDGTLRFLLLITAFSLPTAPGLIAIDEPEAGLHPSMMRIVAEYADDAALRSQVILTTHSAAFLDAFPSERPPAVTVAQLHEGSTLLRTLDPKSLAHWLAEYTLGSLYRSTELEQMKGSVEEESSPPAEVAA